MFIRILPTALLQIFCENLLNFQVIFKSMKIADDTFPGNSECERFKNGFTSEGSYLLAIGNRPKFTKTTPGSTEKRHVHKVYKMRSHR